MYPADLRQALLRYVESNPHAPAIELAHKGETVTRQQLLRRAGAEALQLRASGVRRHDRFVLALDNVPEFAYWFWAAQLLGATVVPVAPVQSERRRAAQLEHIVRVARVAGTDLLVASLRELDANECGGRGLRLLDALGNLSETDELGSASVRPGDLALLQFSSGSTSQPKGCALEHRAVCANARAAADRFRGVAGDSFFNWLPLFHDLGLMGGVIAPVVIGMRCILQTPRAFVFDPLSWLRGLCEAGPVHTSAPNFALALVLRRLRKREHLQLDLRAVKTIICGGEPIGQRIAAEFVGNLTRHGLEPNALFPAYGLAECTVLVAARAGLACSSPAGLADAAPTSLAPSVNLGTAVQGVTVQIVDPEGRTLPDGAIGRIQVRSVSVMRGYFENALATASVLADGWLDTGDLGFMERGELHCVGRTKDVIIIAGRNLLAPEIDLLLCEALQIEPSRLACFTVDGSDTEQLVVALEERSWRAAQPLVERIRNTCFEQFGAGDTAVVVVPVGALPKTSSGKIRRQQLSESFANGQLEVLQAPVRSLAAEEST